MIKDHTIQSLPTAETLMRAHIDALRVKASRARQDAAWCASRAASRETAALNYRSAESLALQMAMLDENEADRLEKAIQKS